MAQPGPFGEVRPTIEDVARVASPMAAPTVPALTSLRQPVRSLAGRAVDVLAAKMRSPRFEVHALERPEPVVREGTSAA